MVTQFDFDEQKNVQELLQCVRFFALKNWCPATSTNHSFRSHRPDRIVITRSGVDKSAIADADVVAVDLRGQLCDTASTLRPSAETELHTMLYARFPDVTCVLHTHSALGTWLSRKERAHGGLRLEGWEILKGLRGVTTHDTAVEIPVVANSQRMPEIIAALAPHWEKRPAGFLIAGHGLYTWGASIAEAKRHIETLEFLFELHHLGATHGHS